MNDYNFKSHITTTFEDQQIKTVFKSSTREKVIQNLKGQLLMLPMVEEMNKGSDIPVEVSDIYVQDLSSGTRDYYTKQEILEM